MRIGVIIPTRKDRPGMLENCLRMINQQTLSATTIMVVDDPPRSNEKDITWRYRTGYDRLRNKGLDIIAFMEDDDWYSPDYLKTMIDAWKEHNMPVIFGTNYTHYYHIRLFTWFTMGHDIRSSAMSTLIKPDMHFDWCVDSNPFTDLFLWQKFGNQGVGTIFNPDPVICMGIKHGIGVCGGRSHINRLNLYKFPDSDHSFLKAITIKDPEGYKFYSNYFKNELIT